MINTENTGYLNIRSFLKAIVNSLIFFALAYVVVWLLYHLAVVLFANGNEIPTVWYFNRIDFMIPEGAWTADRVKITYTSGPLISLIFSLIFLIVYMNTMELNGILRLFFLWAYIHAWTYFFGSIFIGTLTNTGFGHVLVWLYFQDTARLATNLVSLFMLFLGGYIIAKPALFSANYYLNYLPEDSRGIFLTAQLLIPAILGFIGMIVLKHPSSLENHLIPLTSLLMMLPVFMRRTHFSVMYFDDEPIRVKIDWVYLIIAAITVAAYRIIFEVGIRTGFTESVF
jgi:hypothetical protein